MLLPYYIPQDILEIIIGYATADGPYDFSTLSLVSHTFRQIVLPYKLRSLTFRHSNTTFTCSFTGAPIFRLFTVPNFCEVLNAGDAHALSLAPLVQELNLLQWSSGRCHIMKYPMQKPFQEIVNSVISFRNLTKLSMENCVISPIIMELLGKLVQLQTLRTLSCEPAQYNDKISFGALANLHSLHTLECANNSIELKHDLACIPMKKLRILKSNDLEVIEALLTTDPPVQLKELWLTHRFSGDYSLLWNYLARVTSLTHLSLPNLHLPDGTPSLIFHFRKLQYLHIHVAFAPHFANQPMRKMKINTGNTLGEDMVDVVHRHWQGTVFPHVEYLEMDQCLGLIPIEFWREFLTKVKMCQCNDHIVVF